MAGKGTWVHAAGTARTRKAVGVPKQASKQASKQGFSQLFATSTIKLDASHSCMHANLLHTPTSACMTSNATTRKTHLPPPVVGTATY